MVRNISRVLLLCALLALTATTEGCQRGQTWDLAPVEGTVTKDGRPLAGVEVVFWADLDAGTQGPRSSDITDEAGHYRLLTDNGGNGVVLGKHHVCLVDVSTDNDKKVSRVQRDGAQVEPKTPEAKRRVPRRYERFKETPLRVEVHPGPQTLDFQLP
jgi:hypothetical protein